MSGWDKQKKLPATETGQPKFKAGLVYFTSPAVSVMNRTLMR